MLPKVPDGQSYRQPVKEVGASVRGDGGMYVPRLQRKGIADWTESMMPQQVTSAEPSRKVLLKNSEEETSKLK